MWHDLVEKEKKAARNAAHVLRQRIDRLIPARRARPASTAAPPSDAAESPPPRIEEPPERKPPAV